MTRFLIPHRTLLGVLLIAVSVGGVGLVITSSQQTRVVAITAQEVIAGQQISPADVISVVVPDVSVFDTYASPADFAEAPVVSRSLGFGHLVPLGLLGQESLSDDSIVTLELSIGSPDWLQAGALTELWVAPPGAENSFLAPFVLSPEVSILRVSRDEGFAADSLTSRVEVLVPRRHLPGAIHALANGYFVHLSPVGGPRP
jgi:hypothetical protein